MALMRRIFGAKRAISALAGLAMLLLPPEIFAAQLGSTVSNIASVTHGPAGGRITVTPAPASFLIEALRTPSTVEFFRHSPNAPDSRLVALNGSDFSPNGVGPFQPIGPVSGPGGAVLDVSAPLPLTPAENFFGGEVVFVRVEDVGQNGDPSRIETITVRIESATGDEILVQAYETGPNTGEFFGYFESSRSASQPFDRVLTVVQGQDLTATYTDPFDATEVSTDVAGVDPFGRLFDSVTGALIDGAVVTIVDAATGQPASVFGVDGISAYPSTITTGQPVTDTAGVVYTLNPGQFVFPIMFPGDYRLEITPPVGYTAPSVATQADIDALPGGPFVIIPASFLNSFTLDGTGDVTFDAPLDPSGDVIVTKSASAEVASIGDFVRYEIRVENVAATATLLRIRDLMPPGFRYQLGSARRDGAALDDPLIDPGGEALTFAGGTLGAGEAATITYVVEIGAGAENGDAVNRAFAANAAGAPLSNTAQANVFIREDLLRSNLTLVGRVVSDACDPDADWPRAIDGGQGVPGVRLYLETGAYVVTDEDGLFHFEDVTAKRHVIQLDEASLPEGYEPVICENNTRYAGSAISQFVDVQGGSVWRANFYLRKTERAFELERQAQSESDDAFVDALEYKQFDNSWLNGATGKSEFVYPAEGRTPSTRSIHIGVKHPNFTRVTLLLNGSKAPGTNFSGREVNKALTVAMSRWRGVDLVDGENTLTAVVADEAGNEIDRLERTIVFVSEAERAEFLPDRSRLVADGRTPPIVALRVTDAVGRPVHAGRLIPVQIEPPYRARDLQRLEDASPLTEPLAAVSNAIVGPDGIARIELEPTLQTGAARLSILLDNDKREDIDAFLKPELRDWIVVGLAEGGLSNERTDPAGAPAASDLLRDGRVAIFAKGTVKGDWLVTAAVDTDKERGDVDDQVFDDVDPDARYSVYGDRSRQDFEAESRFPFYLKAEKGGFQATFGDYDTGLDESRLGAYSRRLSGLQTVYESRRFSFRGFAAETNQDFMRDEIAADGTSGPFRLSASPLVRNSETIVVETRNRFRPDEILEVTPLIRYFDYDIDFQTGEIVLRLPVPAAPGQAGLNVIVAEYESATPAERNIVGGGRGAVRFADGRVEAGLTAIYEEGRPGAVDASSNLGAVDLRVDVTDTTRLRVEYGRSRRQADGGAEDGDAILAEVDHVSGRLTARAYFDQTDAGYGLGQQSSGVAGVRRVGAEARLRVKEFYSDRTGDKGERSIEGEAYHEENIVTGARRLVANLKLRHDGAFTSAAAGIRRVVEETADGVKRRATLATAEASQRFEKLGLTLRASREQPIAGDNDSITFPQRTTFGFEQTLFKTVRLDVSHEISEGDNVNSSNTIVGIIAEPWSGARLTTAADRITQDTGERIGATFGVDQQVQIDEYWSGSFGVSRREELSASGSVSAVDDIVPDSALSPLENNEDFTSVFIGAGYRDERAQGSARFEMKKSLDSTRYTGVLSAAREVTETLSFAGAMRIEQNDNNDAADERRIDARFGLAVRPRGEGVVIFDRFDVKQQKIEGELTSWKAINNLGANVMLSDRWQVSVNHGIKYSVFDADNDNYTGFTQLAGLESRFDVTKQIDIGARIMALYSHNAGTMEYSFGPSIGVNPANNIWISAGYNFDGFKDDDFPFAEYTRQGPFVRLRIKFDQNSAEGLLNAVSPER